MLELGLAEFLVTLGKTTASVLHDVQLLLNIVLPLSRHHSLSVTSGTLWYLNTLMHTLKGPA